MPTFDPTAEAPIPLKDVPRLPWLKKFLRAGSGRKLAFSTLWRWTHTGIDGVKLETVRIGDTLCTSEEALKRFFCRTTPPAEQATTSAAEQRRPDRARATRELDAAGIR